MDRHIRFFQYQPALWRPRVTAVVTLVALVLGIGLPRTAWSVVIDTSTGTGNTSAPADNPGWANVGVLGIGTGVYLGNDWVLTTKQVGGGSIVLNGGTYAMLAGSGTQLTNGGEPGKTPLTNLYMFRLATTPVGLGSVTIASSSGTGAAVTMIGAGLDRGAFTQWDINMAATPWSWTEVQSGAMGLATRRSQHARCAGEPIPSAAWADGSPATMATRTSWRRHLALWAASPP